MIPSPPSPLRLFSSLPSPLSLAFSPLTRRLSLFSFVFAPSLHPDLRRAFPSSLVPHLPRRLGARISSSLRSDLKFSKDSLATLHLLDSSFRFVKPNHATQQQTLCSTILDLNIGVVSLSKCKLKLNLLVTTT
ncbi:hypothetical protein Scep_026734 [Stephania cephalantha]|uniref:Uncharacterized protein n=1 Tax=Stephania cephalantha TaxID=152367 RepID=A0AAP0HTK5_9MAGN